MGPKQTSPSISGDTKILIRDNEKVSLVRVDSLVDKKTSESKIIYNNLECLTVTDDYKTKWSKISYVFSCLADNIYRLRGSGGLNLRAAGEHSVIVFAANGNLVEKKLNQLLVDDLLVSSAEILTPTENKFEEFIFNLDQYAYLKHKHTDLKDLKVTKDIMRMFGFYMAEGGIYFKKGKSYHMSFVFNIDEKNYTEDIKKIMSNIGITTYYEYEIKEKNTRRLEYSNKPLVSFMLDNFGTGSRKKRIPSWMYSLPREYFIEFMRGYIGDARILKNVLSYTSVNKKMIENIAYLSKLNGIDCCMQRRLNKEHLSPQKTIIKSSVCWDLIFRGKNVDLIMDKKVDRSKFKSINQDLIGRGVFRGLSSNKKIIRDKKTISKFRILNNIKETNEKLINICRSGLHIVRIKSITKLCGVQYAYNLYVPETHRFFGGNYPILLSSSEYGVK